MYIISRLYDKRVRSTKAFPAITFVAAHVGVGNTECRRRTALRILYSPLIRATVITQLRVAENVR